MLMILFVVPVGSVVGQTNSANAIRIDVYEKCEFKTMELYKFQQAWFVFQSKDSLTQITVADHIATYAPAPVFDTVIVYDKNMTIVAVFSEDSADWSEIVSTPMVGSDYYLFVKSNSYFDKCDFDMCLERGCVPDIDMPNLIYCANDNYFVVEYTACQTGTIGNLFINDNTLIESQQIQIGASPNTYYFSIPFTAPGTYSITFCIFSTISNINEYCETFTVTILPTPTIEIEEGDDITICPGTYDFHDISTDALDIEWTLYYYYPGIGWNSFIPVHYGPNSQYPNLFTDIGLYYLVSTAIGDCGVDSDTIYIEVVPPSAEFTWTNACLGSSVCFTELSNCEEYWHWDFGDGSTSDEQNPCHDYAQAGNYLVTLEVAPGITVSHTITVYSPVQPVISGDDYACGTSSHYQVTPAGAFSQIGWAVNSPSGWVSTVPSDEYNHSWTNGTGGVVYVETTDNNGCFARTEMMVFDCCSGGDISWYNTQIVSTGTIIQKTIVINGTQNVLQSGTHVFINGSTILMGPNAKVTIEDGAWVRIGKSIIEACNGLMWDGLFVENGGYLQMDGNILIKDAKNAVVSIDGGECVIDANHFDKNFQHIVIEPYSSSHSAVIERNHLECSGTLLPQYPPVIAFRTQDAIYINGVSNINIGNLKKGNTISNCDIGILAMNSFIRVVGNTFSNIEPGSIAIGQPSHPRGYGILSASMDLTGNNPYGLSTMPSTLSKSGGNTFTNVTNGIYSFNNGQVYIAKNTFNYQNNPMGHGTAISISEWSHPSTNKTITTNAISNYNKGILVTGTNNARVSGNTISNLKLIPASFSNLRAMGIRIEGGSNNIVQGNTVQNNNASSADWRWEGISVSNSGSLVVSCNTIRKMGKSIRFQGVNDPVQIKKNAMFNGTAGIVLSDGGF
ncbi:MAG: right-handed parallel beta-helix repeat-containing protein, partial [Bacteroidales bacterium]|nr:right-handed parallel beta-helix repeat-containing protein [Bacteroidales bacterium]